MQLQKKYLTMEIEKTNTIDCYDNLRGILMHFVM